MDLKKILPLALLLGLHATSFAWLGGFGGGGPASGVAGTGVADSVTKWADPNTITDSKLFLDEATAAKLYSSDDNDLILQAGDETVDDGEELIIRASDGTDQITVTADEVQVTSTDFFVETTDDIVLDTVSSGGSSADIRLESNDDIIIELQDQFSIEGVTGEFTFEEDFLITYNDTGTGQVVTFENGDTGDETVIGPGYMTVPSVPSSIPAGSSGDYTIFSNSAGSGELSVRHGTGAIISLEAGAIAGPDPNFSSFVNQDEAPGSTITVDVLDTTATTGLTLPGTNSNEPGGVTQGKWQAVAEILAGSYGNEDVGVYYLKAYGSFILGASAPIVLSTFGTEKEDGDGAGGDDCNFVGVSGASVGIEVQCIGYENYTGWVRIKFVGGGTI